MSDYKLRKIRKHLADRLLFWLKEKHDHTERMHPQYASRGPSRSCGWCRTVRHALGEIEQIKRLVGVILVAVMFTGCRGLDRLTGGGDDNSPAPVTAPAPLQILGAWEGELFSGQILINGGVIDADVVIASQTEGAVSGTWVLSVEVSDQPDGPPPILVSQGTLTGTVDAAGAFSYALEESPTCHGTAVGTVSGQTMTVTWTGQTGCNFWFTGTGTLSK